MDSSGEFYRKTANLFEEFQKREINLLNIELNRDNSAVWNSNMPTHEYLQKINKREKETEQTYRNLMKRLQTLDETTDSVTLKLEKLNALRNCVISPTLPNFSSGDVIYSRPHLSNYLPRNVTNLNSCLEASTQSVSIQTDYIFCQQCHYPFTINTTSSESNANNENIQFNHTKGILSKNELVDEPSDSVQTQKQSVNSTATGGVDLGSSNFMNPIAGDIGIADTPNRLTYKIEMASGLGDVVDDKSSETVSDLCLTSVDETNVVSKTTVNPLMDVGETRMTTKSDDESINHEFDFLESDKRSCVELDRRFSVEDSANKTVSYSLSHINVPESSKSPRKESVDKMVSSPDTVSASNLQTVQVFEIPVQNKQTRNMDNLNVEESRRDSSASEEPHSPSVYSAHDSVASDSDSFFAKETPLTASAAYQAMLGNVAPSKASYPAPVSSNSDSDEVEHVLATAVRKSSVIPTDVKIPGQKVAEEREIIPEYKSTNTSRKSSLAVINKPQSKLSKNTRKVLGLDTSSGSEVELDIKPPVNPNAEDSDEFYD